MLNRANLAHDIVLRPMLAKLKIGQSWVSPSEIALRETYLYYKDQEICHRECSTLYNLVTNWLTRSGNNKWDNSAGFPIS